MLLPDLGDLVAGDDEMMIACLRYSKKCGSSLNLDMIQK